MISIYWGYKNETYQILFAVKYFFSYIGGKQKRFPLHMDAKDHRFHIISENKNKSTQDVAHTRKEVRNYEKETDDGNNDSAGDRNAFRLW